MLRIETPTGSLELSATEERTVRSMSDADICRELNNGERLFMFAALKERPNIRLHPTRGWIPASTLLQ
jgi:hypothetical protein